MSELKTFDSQRIYWAVEQVERVAGDIAESHLDDNVFYIKSEVDEVIAKLNAEIKRLMDWNKKETRCHLDIEMRSKYKRCLTIAERCLFKSWAYVGENQRNKARLMWKWRQRWLDIAKTFQPQ